MKGFIFVVWLSFVLVGCDTEATLFIENNRTESIEIRTEGGELNVYGKLTLLAEEDEKFSYELEQQSSHMVIQLINESISESNIPFDKLQIYSSDDTVRLESKLEIFEGMILISEDYFKIIVN